MTVKVMFVKRRKKSGSIETLKTKKQAKLSKTRKAKVYQMMT